MSIKVIKNFVPKEKYPIKSPYRMKPIGICVHNTANDASAKNEIAYMVRNDFQISFHYAVDDVQIVQGLPEDRNGWHAGDGNGVGNRKHIAIEICYSKSGGDRFLKAEKNAVLLIVDILKRYNWDISKVKKHQDFSGKYCPHRTLDMGWQRFLNMIKTELEGEDWRRNAVTLPEDKRKYVANKDTALYAIANGKVIKEFKKGKDIGVKYRIGNWYVTEYSFDRDIRNGFKVQDFDLYIEPEPALDDPKPPLEIPDDPTTPPMLPDDIEALKLELKEMEEQNQELLKGIFEYKESLLKVEEELEEVKAQRDKYAVERNRYRKDYQVYANLYNEEKNKDCIKILIDKLFGFLKKK